MATSERGTAERARKRASFKACRNVASDRSARARVAYSLDRGRSVFSPASRTAPGFATIRSRPNSPTARARPASPSSRRPFRRRRVCARPRLPPLPDRPASTSTPVSPSRRAPARRRLASRRPAHPPPSPRAPCTDSLRSRSSSSKHSASESNSGTSLRLPRNRTDRSGRARRRVPSSPSSSGPCAARSSWASGYRSAYAGQRPDRDVRTLLRAQGARRAGCAPAPRAVPLRTMPGRSHSGSPDTGTPMPTRSSIPARRSCVGDGDDRACTSGRLDVRT